MHRLIYMIVVSISLATASQIIGVNDPNWYFTEYNWYKDPQGNFVQSANPGSYFKVGFTGTSIAITIDQSASPKSPFMIISYSIDLHPWVDIQLPSANDTLILASNLQNANHQITFYIKASVQTDDRWYFGPEDRLKIFNMLLDDSANTLPPTLKTMRTLVYWDSIGEGVLVLGNNGGDLVNNDGLKTWAIALATALDSEISVVAFGRQGYTIDGNGNVPPLFTPGNDTNSAWNKFDVDHSRLDSEGQLSPPPDYIFCGHGTNDMNAQDQPVTASALGWLVAVRQAAPTSNVFMVVPFGGFKRNAINTAFTTYQSKYHDSFAFYLDLGSEAAIGLTGVKGGSLYSADGLHPLVFRDGQLGALLAVTALHAVQSDY